MTYLGKKQQSDEQKDQSGARNGATVNVNAIVKKDDILKQSIKTVGYEDTSVFFVQSGRTKNSEIHFFEFITFKIRAGLTSLLVASFTRFFSTVCMAHCLHQGLGSWSEPGHSRRCWAIVTSMRQRAGSNQLLCLTGSAKRSFLSLMLNIYQHDDRNGASFNTILDIYRTGMFHLCDSTCATIRNARSLGRWRFKTFI